MRKALSPEARVFMAVVFVAAVVGAMLLTRAIPPVVGLGDSVRLPMFHGGSTWVNLMTFSLMGLFSVAYLLFGREDLYRWEAGFRWWSAPLWLANTGMGIIAAMSSWDFTGSDTPPISVVMDDPRLLAQLQLLIMLAALIGAHALFDSRKLRSLFDTVFVAVMWWLMIGIFTDPHARALHPDSPVLNSGSDIQIPFFGIVGLLFFASLIFAWLWRDHILRND